MNAIAKIKASVIPAAKHVALPDVEVSKAVQESKQSRNEWGRVLTHKMSNGHTVADTIPHMVAQYDKVQLIQHEVLDLYRSIGSALIEIRAVIGKSDKMFGQFIATTALADISRQDRADCMWLAENWAKVQAANVKGKLDQLSVSRIRFLLKEDTQPRQTVAKDAAPKGAATSSEAAKASNASVGATVTKAKAEPKVEAPVAPVAELDAMTPAELAAETLVKLDRYGITVAEFAAALMAQVKARQG